jgi:hypothetical protein
MNPDCRAQARSTFLVQCVGRHVRQEAQTLTEAAYIFAVEYGLVNEIRKHRDSRDAEQKAIDEAHPSVSLTHYNRLL